MIVIPSIDLLNGQSVRLRQGAFDQVTAYTEKPQQLSELALAFEAQGAKRLHLVDLNGSLTGNLQELETLKAIRQTLQIPIQIGGGIRTFDQAKACIDLGFEVVLGTLLITDPFIASTLFKAYPSQIIAALDCRPSDSSGGSVAIRGWTEQTQYTAASMIKSLESMGCEKFLYTDITRDGMLTGPALTALAELKNLTQMDLIASGGIHAIGDLLALNQLGCLGAIVGKALYENIFTLEEANQALTASENRLDSPTKRGVPC